MKINNGYKLTLSGKPSTQVMSCEVPCYISLCPSAIDNVKPKLLVKVGDFVNQGQAVFHDKSNKAFIFVAPCSGTIDAIQYGPRRVIDKVVIKVALGGAKESLKKISKESLSQLSRESLLDHLLRVGAWPLFRSFPFKNIPDPSIIPPSIYVSLSDLEPHKPQAEVFLKGKEDLFLFGLTLLKKLAKQVVVSISDSDAYSSSKINEAITMRVKGDYPATDPGVVLYHHKKTNKENNAWYISPQDLLYIASLLRDGVRPEEYIISIGGPWAKNPCHMKVPYGIHVEDILGKDSTRKKGQRMIAGGVFTGRVVSSESALSCYEDALLLIQESAEPVFLPFMGMGRKKQSYSKSFLSALNPFQSWGLNTNLNGSVRDCISCQHCEQICPVDLAPEFLLKNITGDDVEESIRLGLLDCVECGLCSYVCPAKIELDDLFVTTKKALHKEMHA